METLMQGYEVHQNLNQPERTAEARWTSPLAYSRFVLEDTAARVAASKANFPWTFFRGDCHSHTQHSDGIGTVAETADMVKAAGLDFQFVTDHWGVTQAAECLEHGLWYGQEPITRGHHLGVLGLEYAFTPAMDFLADFERALSLGATTFVPHPTGWWPNVRYLAGQRKILEELASPFLMEICNGANNIISAFDVTDDDAIALWDHLLSLGRTVHAMGNTDAHAPHGIGIVWNGVFADTCDQPSVLSALRQGHSFVSDAGLIHIALGAARMGDGASASDRSQGLEITAVDQRGLASVRVVADSATILLQHLDGAKTWKHQMDLPTDWQKYVRVELRSTDGRRAYSNPIYCHA